MLAYEKNFTESNFHNVNLVTTQDFPKAIALIYQDYKNSTDFSYDKPRAWIQTSASKSNSRISSNLKSKLTSLQAEGSQEMDSRLSHRKSHAKFSNTRLQAFPSETTGILKTENDNYYNNSIDGGENNYYHQNHANTSLRQDYLTPQRGQKFTDESMHAHMDTKNSQLSNNKYLDQSSPNINVFKPQAEDQKNDVSSLHNYRHKGRDPFLQRLSEYKGIYDSFKYKYESKLPQKADPEPAKLENSTLNNERVPAPERVTRNEVIIQEETPPQAIYNNNPVKNAQKPAQSQSNNQRIPPQNEIITTQEDDTLSSIGLRNPPKNLKNIQNPTPVIQQDTPPAQYQKPVIQQDTPPSGGLGQYQKAPAAARKVPQQQDTPPSKGLRLSQHSIRHVGLNLEKETPPHSNNKVPKYPTQNEISPISAAVENKYNRTQKNNHYYQHQPYQQTQQTPSDQESLMNLKASLDEQDAQRTIKKGQNNHQKLRERQGKSQEVIRKVNRATQMTPDNDEEEEESYHDKGIQAEIPLPKKNAFTIKKRQGSVTDMHRRSGGSDYEVPESHHVSPPKVLKRGGIKNNYTPRRDDEEERYHQEPFYRHERREKSTKKLPTPRSISQDSSMYHHQYDQRKRPDPLEGRVPLRNQAIAARKKQQQVEEDPRFNEPEEEESQAEEEEEEVTREVPRKKKLAAVRVSRKEHPSLKKIKEISPLRVDGRSLEQREDRLPTILREKLYKNDASLRSLLSNQHDDYYEDAGSKRTLPIQNRHRNHHERALHDSAMDLTNNEEGSIILKTEHHNYNHRSRSAARQRKQKLSPMRSNPMGEDSYRNFTHNIATLITNYSNPLGDCEPEVLVGRFIEEIKSHHPILSKFSYRALKEIIQGCNILNLKNTEIYREKEHNEYSYIILYGEVFLKNKTFGVFKHCQIGECVGEEALIDGNYTKQETAQVIDAAALIEINQTFIDYFKEAIGSGYRGDYTLLLGMLRKSLTQKKMTKQRMITGKK